MFGRLLTNVLGPKKEQGPGGFETLPNVSLRNLYLRINYWHDKAIGKGNKESSKHGRDKK